MPRPGIKYTAEREFEPRCLDVAWTDPKRRDKRGIETNEQPSSGLKSCYRCYRRCVLHEAL